jgi:hypothetical protein
MHLRVTYPKTSMNCAPFGDAVPIVGVEEISNNIRVVSVRLRAGLRYVSRKVILSRER